MDGYAADLEALEDTIKKAVEPWILQSEEVLKLLGRLELGDATGMVGHGAMPPTVVLNSTCAAFASAYDRVASAIVGKHTKFNETQWAFRDTLQQVLDSYRANELRQEDTFKTILRDL